MATSKRTDKIWEQADPEVKKVISAYTGELLAFKKNFKTFYQDVLAPDVKDLRTGKTHAQMWGKLHDILVDFMHFEEIWLPPHEEADVSRRVQSPGYSVHTNSTAAVFPDQETFTTPLSRLKKYLPAKNAKGIFNERWIYFRTLDGEPEIQDGATGPIREMYEHKFWQGVLIRIKGDGMLKSILTPRGHLKSSILTEAYTLWRIIKDLETRILIRCLEGGLAASFVGTVKAHFEFSDKFRKYFSALGPPSRHGVDKGRWNENEMQVKTKLGWRSSGKEPTLTAKGMEADVTGKHFQRIILDDVVGEENSNTEGLRQKGCKRVRSLFAIRDPGTPIVDIGTVWEDTDSHSIFTDIKRSDVAKRGTSFIIATALDGDESVKVSGNLSQLGYGKPIWPEKYTLDDLEDVRAGMNSDHQWYGQYFNQIKGASMRLFRKEWVQRYTERAEDLARDKRLHIFFYLDPTQGKKEQIGKTDYTAAFVLGQTRDRKHFYWLDGFHQKMNADIVPNATLDLALKWKEIAYANNAYFNAAIEESSFTQYLHTSLTLAMRTRGDGAYVDFKPFKTNNIAKYDHVRKLALPYSHGKFSWPETMFVMPLNERGEAAGEPYDMCEIGMEQIEKYPGVPHDDFIDAHAGAFAMTYAEDWKQGAQEEAVETAGRGAYSRKAVQFEPSHLGGFDNEDASWSGGLEWT